jgi:hypothetical protein
MEVLPYGEITFLPVVKQIVSIVPMLPHLFIARNIFIYLLNHIGLKLRLQMKEQDNQAEFLLL